MSDEWKATAGNGNDTYVHVRIGEAPPNTITCLDRNIWLTIALHDICIDSSRTPQASELETKSVRQESSTLVHECVRIT